MVNVKLKIAQIFPKLCTQGFLTWLIPICKLDFQNSKWWIQYGGGRNENPINSSDTLFSGVFGVADYESDIIFSKFRIADPI